MSISRFEDIIAWQKARAYNLDIYKNFSDIKDYSFRDQIQRASVSVSNNIAEGFSRNGNAEFIRFLYISRASCSELQSMLYLSKDIGYINEKTFDFLYKKAVELSKLINGLINYLKKTKKTTP